MWTTDVERKAMIKPRQGSINLWFLFDNKRLDCQQKDLAFRQAIQEPLVQQFVRGGKRGRTDRSLEACVKYLKDREAAGFDVNMQAVGFVARTDTHRNASFTVEVSRKVVKAWRILWEDHEFLSWCRATAVSAARGFLMPCCSISSHSMLKYCDTYRRSPHQQEAHSSVA